MCFFCVVNVILGSFGRMPKVTRRRLPSLPQEKRSSILSESCCPWRRDHVVLPGPGGTMGDLWSKCVDFCGNFNRPRATKGVPAPKAFPSKAMPYKAGGCTMLRVLDL